MQAIATIGLDIAKSVFQVHGVDAAGQVVIRRQLKRRYVLAFFQKFAQGGAARGVATTVAHSWLYAPFIAAT
jgi:transposase